MKRLGLLMAIMTASLCSFSQVLKPIVQLSGRDTILCWTAIQAKDIAKRIAEGQSCAKDVIEYKEVVKTLDSLVLVKDRQITLLKQESRNSVEIDRNYEKMTTGLNKDLAACNKSNRRNKLFLKISIIGMIVFGTVAVVK